MNKVVAHFLNGTVAKGLTVDFLPNKDRFHLVVEGAPALEVLISELKGLFFVKDLEGDLGHAKSNIFHPGDMSPGRRIRVEFKDGETLMGTTQAYTPGRTGFFVVPADKKSNTERAFIITSATSSISLL
ncbi:DUF6982 domain-containing protein [Mesoterricola silvestris]|uniref:Uncharacterized protein n=1 Tax=Mesoterricola silvestris TaxID=2927979 RepID=A0AA48KBF8_9BACT|nr:hypothetical protein [Mesoterricola silvestris]BDU74287.1 hypothetical protein METEAL_34610 [Mesoterricola silvestris]